MTCIFKESYSSPKRWLQSRKLHGVSARKIVAPIFNTYVHDVDHISKSFLNIQFPL
jgi:hypothetical protein